MQDAKPLHNPPEYIILVDALDNQTGTCEKLQAHKQGLLHRAFSVFIFNDQQQLLIQQRSFDKYHSGGLWSNTCCSHYRPDEDPKQAPRQRLQEEMGFACELRKIFTFTYKIKLETGLYEHEIDHIFVGNYSGTVSINHKEVAAYVWQDPRQLLDDFKQTPGKYTYWFKELLEKVLVSI